MEVGSLRNRAAVVTGASSGIGAAVVGALSAGGASVALAARREDALLEVQSGLESRKGKESILAPTDVTDREQVRSLVSRAEEELGSVEILVNCAGVMYYTLMKNRREEEWERTVEVNCKGTLNCVGAVLPGMLERGRGHIVTISSDAGRKVFPASRSTRRASSSWRRSPRACGSRRRALG
ncbi:MAG: SDR family NAD(P)-dependent oxidoreductase [Rubrobacter sp.]